MAGEMGGSGPTTVVGGAAEAGGVASAGAAARGTAAGGGAALGEGASRTAAELEVLLAARDERVKALEKLVLDDRLALGKMAERCGRLTGERADLGTILDEALRTPAGIDAVASKFGEHVAAAVHADLHCDAEQEVGGCGAHATISTQTMIDYDHELWRGAGAYIRPHLSST